MEDAQCGVESWLRGCRISPAVVIRVNFTSSLVLIPSTQLRDALYEAFLHAFNESARSTYHYGCSFSHRRSSGDRRYLDADSSPGASGRYQNGRGLIHDNTVTGGQTQANPDIMLPWIDSRVAFFIAGGLLPAHACSIIAALISTTES